MQAQRRRTLVLIALVAIVVGAVAAPALAAETVQPGTEPTELDPTRRPHGGVPAPDELFWKSPNSCDAKRFKGRTGTRRLYAFIEYWWPRVENWGFGSKPCRNSLHDEGRAVDLHLDVRVRKDRRAAHQIKRFFLRRDSEGGTWAMARRFGIQEFIYNCHIWTSTYAEQGWRGYSRCGEASATYTLKHKDHIHIGQSWQGARKRTSAYRGYDVCDECTPEEPEVPASGFKALPDTQPRSEPRGNPVARSHG